jgi:hypothetical protein
MSSRHGSGPAFGNQCNDRGTDEPVSAIAPQAELDPLLVYGRRPPQPAIKSAMNGWLTAAWQSHPPPADAVSLNSADLGCE